MGSEKSLVCAPAGLNCCISSVLPKPGAFRPPIIQDVHMCFSAEASFAVAGINTVIGLAVLRRRPTRKESLLASFPLLFAVQQFAEGILWLTLPGAAAGEAEFAIAAMLFIVIAESVWLALTPIAVLMLEEDRRRRRILYWLAGLGLLVGAYLLYAALASPLQTDIYDRNIRYFNNYPYLTPSPLFYVMAVGAPLLISSHTVVRLFGVIVIMGFAMSLYLYIDTLVSVWCFFAAAASGILYFHFQRPHTA
jgi:hypothetical protein